MSGTFFGTFFGTYETLDTEVVKRSIGQSAKVLREKFVWHLLRPQSQTGATRIFSTTEIM